MRSLIVALALTGPLWATGSLAQPAGARIDVVATNFKFAPSIVHLHRGAPYVLVLHNQAKGGHSFAARDFFAASEMPAADRARLKDGKVEVPPGGEVSLAVAPKAPGTYRFTCTHPLHNTFGMTGTIVVD
ncbi:MAG TPA: cupredoxin domain-containing protein [Caulobacteraceae bacterium]|nr:cupredoxin domain-containing protein [Caulobacteraceae bacterium]